MTAESDEELDYAGSPSPDRDPKKDKELVIHLAGDELVTMADAWKEMFAYPG